MILIFNRIIVEKKFNPSQGSDGKPSEMNSSGQIAGDGYFVIKLFDLNFRQSAIIKQEMLSLGAEAVVSWKVSSRGNIGQGGDYEALLTGNINQYQQLIEKLKQQPLGLAEIAAGVESTLLSYESQTINPVLIKGKAYDFNNKTYVMGIINVTPDSFSNDGLYQKENYIDLAVRQAQQMVADGADFLDLGAESSRPGFTQVSEEDELKRLLPVLKELVNAVDVPISVDTCKPEVARQAINIGASMINDIWGLKSPEDPERRMAKIIGDAKVPVVIMHNKTEPVYQFLLKEIVESLNHSIELASQYGISLQQIIIDPGIGFGKTYHDNLKVLHNLDQLKVLNRPVLLGTSRKSVIGLTLDLPVNERLEGTIATVVWGVSKGVNIVRVHDVKEVARAVKMCDAIIKQ